MIRTFLYMLNEESHKGENINVEIFLNNLYNCGIFSGPPFSKKKERRNNMYVQKASRDGCFFIFFS